MNPRAVVANTLERLAAASSGQSQPPWRRPNLSAVQWAQRRLGSPRGARAVNEMEPEWSNCSLASSEELNRINKPLTSYSPRPFVWPRSMPPEGARRIAATPSKGVVVVGG